MEAELIDLDDFSPLDVLDGNRSSGIQVELVVPDAYRSLGLQVELWARTWTTEGTEQTSGLLGLPGTQRVGAWGFHLVFQWQQASRDAGRGVGQGMECRGDQAELDAAGFVWRGHRQAGNWGKRLTWWSLVATGFQDCR